MKNLLLAKSNLRKNKGLSICISILILISSLLISIAFLLIFDYDKNAYKEAKRLNTSDKLVYSIKGNDINEKYIKSILPDEVEEYLFTKNIITQVAIEYNDGEVTPFIMLSKDTKRSISKYEVIEEDENILNNYIYIPYHLHTGGGINIGDEYKIKMPYKTYTFKVKGYINVIFSGSYNVNLYEMIISDENYNKIIEENENIEGFSLYINYKKNVDKSLLTNKLTYTIYKDTGVGCTSSSIDTAIFSRTFISMIFFASFLVTSMIIILIVILMIFNNIVNYIKENMKSLGALKAIGYTSRDLKKSLLIQFSFITIISLISGIILSYLLMPFVSTILINQSGIPYTVKFNLLSLLLTILIIPSFVILIVLFSSKKLKKLEPIIAIRDGVETHNFNKNYIPLDKSKLSLNTSLSLKNMFKNVKQNIISFITVIFLSFSMVVAVVMYQNFSREPKLSLLTFEIVDGVITVDSSIKDEVRKDLESNSNVSNVKSMITYEIMDKDYAIFVTYIVDNPDKINNKDACYEGRFPKYDNEVAISGKYASEKGYKIGDEISFLLSGKSYSYLISGFIQSTNNNGREVVFINEGASHIMDIESMDTYYYFDSSVKSSEIIKEFQDKYNENIKATLDFEELIKAQTKMFIQVANSMLIIISIITGSIVFLVLYLLMKTLIYDRRYEYGILKAVGYKSKDLIIQNVLSFMPTIVFGTIIGAVISYFVTNPYIGMMMRPFGIMKCTMVMPIDLMILSVLFIILISFISAILMSLKIKKIEPCDLLKNE